MRWELISSRNSQTSSTVIASRIVSRARRNLVCPLYSDPRRASSRSWLLKERPHADAKARSDRAPRFRAVFGRQHVRLDDGSEGVGGRARRLRRGRRHLHRYHRRVFEIETRCPGRRAGESEKDPGKWRRAHSNRRAVIIATKVMGPMGPGPNDTGLSRQHIVEGVEDSLRRLQTDFIDLYQAHWDDRDTPLEE